MANDCHLTKKKISFRLMVEGGEGGREKLQEEEEEDWRDLIVPLFLLSFFPLARRKKIFHYYYFIFGTGRKGRAISCSSSSSFFSSFCVTAITGLGRSLSSPFSLFLLSPLARHYQKVVVSRGRGIHHFLETVCVKITACLVRNIGEFSKTGRALPTYINSCSRGGRGGHHREQRGK